MQTENLTRPGLPPQNGDFIRIKYPNGNVEEKHYWEPPPEEVVPMAVP